MNFERGKDTKEALGIGWEYVLKDIGGEIFYERDVYQSINHQFFTLGDIELTNIRCKREKLYRATIIIVVIGSHFKIIKNRFSNEYGGIYKCKYLPQMVLDLKRVWEKHKNIIEEL